MIILDKYIRLAQLIGQSRNKSSYKSITDANFDKLCGGKNKTSNDITEKTLTKERLRLANRVWRDIYEAYKNNELHILYESTIRIREKIEKYINDYVRKI